MKLIKVTKMATYRFAADEHSALKKQLSPVNIGKHGDSVCIQHFISVF
jgi:hypothetical protein